MTVATNVRFSPWIWFRFDTQENNPPTFRVAEGVELVHPILAGRPGMPGLTDDEHQEWLWRVDRICYVPARQLVFLSDEHLSPDTADPIIYNLCRKLRLLARQPWLPPQIQSTGHLSDEQSAPDVSGVNVLDYFPPPLESPIYGVRRGHVECAATLEHLELALRMPDDFDFPAYAEFMLDACYAFDTRDYRRTILYTAIAVEAVATETLTQAYNEVVADPARRPEFRVREITDREGTRRADPIYRMLSRGNNWRTLVHELPLYLFGRSLQLDEPALYEQLNALQNTRNAIAHGNRPDASQNSLPITGEAALDAVARAKDAFRWFGKDTRYPLDPSDTVSLTANGVGEDLF